MSYGLKSYVVDELLYKCVQGFVTYTFYDFDATLVFSERNCYFARFTASCKSFIPAPEAADTAAKGMSS